MKCPKCGSDKLNKSGKVAPNLESYADETLKKQQYKCQSCGHRTVNPGK